MQALLTDVRGLHCEPSRVLVGDSIIEDQTQPPAVRDFSIIETYLFLVEID